LDSGEDAADQRDIAAALRGDEAAYARIMARHQDAIAAQMWRFSRDHATHAELVQEVFVEAYTSLRSYRASAPLRHWLRRVATHTGLRHWRHQARDHRRRAQLAAEAAAAPDWRAAEEPSEAAAALHGLLARLGPEDRLVLTLHYFEECDMREIAERTGWSRPAVKVRALRARRRLRLLLEAHGIRSTQS
jgi:RNA polymerase sigma-70 factor (ECF subfamily)